MKLDRLIQTITGVDTAETVTTPTAATGADDPNVDATGEGLSPIDGSTLVPPNYMNAPSAPAPVATIDTYVPPGAPSHTLQVAPTQNLGVANYTVPVNDPLRVAPGSSTPRRVTITVLELAGAATVHMSPDRRQDASGALLMNSQVYTFTTGAPIWLFCPATATDVSVIIEPA